MLEDKNIFISNAKDELDRHVSYFILPEIVSGIGLGISEEKLYQLIGSRKFNERFTYNLTLPKRIKYLKYIPVSKIVVFFGGSTTVTRDVRSTRYNTRERMSVTFYFYRDRLIHKTIIHTDNVEGKKVFLPLTSDEIMNAKPYVPDSLDTTNGLAGTNYWHDAKYYGFVNGFLAEKKTLEGKRYFIPNVKVSNYILDEDFFTKNYCELFAYWEFPDFESDLQKSGYYQLKAKLDKDYEYKTGYWAVKENSKF
ncbi:hypothetical protein EHQ43_01520 [Leptospira bouyouniensis]|uniref:Uncharacterized protein n=1 Tax=Leptospira bouyouniensis TaxID=2484911 RepID=A0A7I0HWU7_9LEPT|nr:hypothetical protein [Leptospira bouyouniensis]TGL09162.1 hypothetical protein EHQ43_01520 [Leptospira bouyouniensis]